MYSWRLEALQDMGVCTPREPVESTGVQKLAFMHVYIIYFLWLPQASYAAFNQASSPSSEWRIRPRECTAKQGNEPQSYSNALATNTSFRQKMESLWSYHLLQRCRDISPVSLQVTKKPRSRYVSPVAHSRMKGFPTCSCLPVFGRCKPVPLGNNDCGNAKDTDNGEVDESRLR